MTTFTILFEPLLSIIAIKNMIQVLSFNAVCHNLQLIPDLSTDKEYTKSFEKSLIYLITRFLLSCTLFESLANESHFFNSLNLPNFY